jgi:hypothetical protein
MGVLHHFRLHHRKKLLKEFAKEGKDAEVMVELIL